MKGGGDTGSADAGGYFKTHSYVTPIYTTFSLDTALSSPLSPYTGIKVTEEIYLFVFILVSMYRFVSKSDRITGLAFHASGFRSDALRCFRPAFALFFCDDE